MGEMQKTVTAIKLEKQHATIVLVLAIFAGMWSSVAVGVLTKNEAEKKPAFMIALCQWAATILFGAGWIWAIYNAYQIYKNSQ